MKKFLILTSAILAVFASCAKKGLDPLPVDDFSDAPWALDETKAVPILLSGGDQFSVKTKAPVHTLDGVQFGVLALDMTKSAKWAPDHESVALYNKVATKGADGYAQFVNPYGPITYYYPLVTVEENNYSFYGYRSSNDLVADNPHAQDGYFADGTFKVDVVIDSVDVLWAKSPEAPVLTKAGESGSYNGFNTKYVRMSRLWYPGTWKTDYSPKFTFNHLTTALHFLVVAETADAAASFVENGEKLVTVENVCIDGVYKQAVLDVFAGTLTSVGSKGKTLIDAEPTLPTAAGSEYGTGLFLLPMSSAELAATPLKISFDINFPNPGNDTPTTYSYNDLDLTPPTGGFLAGKSYTYRIIVKSLEKINIQLELVDWEDGVVDDDVIATIG